MKPAAKSLAISSPMSVHFSLLKRLKRCLTGLESSLIFKACSATFLRILGHIQGLPRKDVSIGVEEVDKRVFLLGGEGGADAHHLVGGVVGVDKDILEVLHRLKGSGRSLRFGCSFSDVLPDGCELL